MILGIDTSGPNLGLALAHESKILASYLSRPGLKHGEILQTEIKQFLKRNQLDFSDLSGLAITLGPGSFTGLRIGLAAAKGYAYALNVPLSGISTLHSAAYAFSNYDKKVVTLFDAKRNEIYWASFDCTSNAPIRLSPDSIGPMENVSAFTQQNATFYGPAHLLQKFMDNFTDSDYVANDNFNLAFPAALLGENDIMQNAQLDTATAVPIYLRS